MRTTRFWDNLYHVHAQNLKIGKPGHLKVFRNNVFKQKQTNKKLKQKETQKNNKQPKNKNKKTKDKAYKQKQTNKNLYNNKKQTIKQKKRLKMKGGFPNILYQSSGVNLT